MGSILYRHVFVMRRKPDFMRIWKCNFLVPLGTIRRLMKKMHTVGRSGGAKVLCTLRHRGVQLILAYSWARPAILVTGKGRGGYFYIFIFSVSSLSFLFLVLPCPTLSSLLLSLLSLFSLSLGDDTKWPTRVDVSFSPNTIKKDAQT